MEEKDFIEKLIEKHKDLLSDSEPSEGHFARFEEKLKKLDSKKKINFSIVWKVAAAVIFVFLAANQAVIWFSPEKDDGLTLAAYSPQFSETEFYYTTAISNGLSQWEQLKKDGMVSATENDLMSNELREFEKMHKDLQEELKANPYDERVVNAMLGYYQAKLSIINMVVNKLKEVQSLNKNSHEVKM